MYDFRGGHLTSEGKEALRRTVSLLRAQLVSEIHDAAERTYRLSVKPVHASLAEPERLRRQRLDAWLDEQVRTVPVAEQAGARDHFQQQAELEAAYTLVHRIVLLRHMEALGLSRPLVVTGGWNSPGYREFRDFAPALCQDDSEGYGVLLRALFDEQALDLRGLFGNVGLTDLFPIPSPSLRKVIEQFDVPELASAWTDDATLGWVYQYWQDSERQALDAKLREGGKIEPHEIAAKTQIFTERYIVEWLLQNSIGQTWLCICEKNEWTPDAEQVLGDLDQRRAAWRDLREQHEVPLDALMPIHSELEDRWRYWVPQPLAADAVAKAPDSVRALKLLDPACGSGHFLVVAFDLLAALYHEEARHRGETWSDRAIAQWILENNLHGIDIDPRCVQLAAAGLLLKAKMLASDSRPTQVNLVAPVVPLADLPQQDPALGRLIAELERAVGIPERLTRAIVRAFAGIDHLGSLFKLEATIDEEIQAYQRNYCLQGDLFNGPPAPWLEVDTPAKAVVLHRIETFLSAHTRREDLGLRLEGEQLAAGVRFVQLLREGSYDIVVGNPPYLGTSKMADATYVAKHYQLGKSDLYAAFLQRGLELVRDGGISAMLTMRNWMFIKQFSAIREWLLDKYHLRLLGHLGWGAFREMKDNPVAMTIFAKGHRGVDSRSIAQTPAPPIERVRTLEHFKSLSAGLLCQAGRVEFDPRAFASVADRPLLFWWSADFLEKYSSVSKVGDVAAVRKGLCTCDNTRFIRFAWEVAAVDRQLVGAGVRWTPSAHAKWVPSINGADGRKWFEPLLEVVNWRHQGLEVKVSIEHVYGVVTKRVQSESYYFRAGVAFSMVGSGCVGRVHRFHSIFGSQGSSIFPDDLSRFVCLINTSLSGHVLQSLNPGVGFEVGDVNRLPVIPPGDASSILRIIEGRFAEREARREASLEFKSPGAADWEYAEAWAQRAVDRPEGAHLPDYQPEYRQEPATDHLSFGVGVALGRFGAKGEGILDGAPESALAHGILFLSAASDDDSLAEPAAEPIVDAWETYGRAIDPEVTLKYYLQERFFRDVHCAMYLGRPIYFPLSSAKRSFVAYVAMHRWESRTLSELLANHLLPEQRRLEGAVIDLQAMRKGPDRSKAREAERRFPSLQARREELAEFIDKVSQLAERGAPPTDSQCPEREVDAAFAINLDDGVMINSAALWPLLEPQWKDPKKWWKELCTARGRKDYDWAQLARRYFPKRVEGKCKKDPSLSVAHGCFWKYHPSKAYAWELRLQDEVGPGLAIDEHDSDEHRTRFLAEHPDEAEAIRENEQLRRERKARRLGDESQDGAEDIVGEAGHYGDDADDSRQSGDGGPIQLPKVEKPTRTKATRRRQPETKAKRGKKHSRR